jgi:hypothetical protein
MNSIVVYERRTSMETNLRKEYESDIRSHNHWGRIDAKRVYDKLKEALADGNKEITIDVGMAEDISLLLMYYCDSKLFDDAYRDSLNRRKEHVDEMLNDVRTVCGIIK